MRKPLAAASLCLGLALPSLTARAGEAMAVRVQSRSPAEFVIEVTTVPETLPLVAASGAGLKFTRLALPEGLGGFIPGVPDVPVVHRLLAVDPGRRYEVQVSLSGRTTAFGIRLAPVQPDVPDTGLVRSFAYDAAAYRLDRELGAETITLGRPAQLGPITVLPVNISPIHYNPARGELTIWRRVTARVRAVGPASRLARPEATLTPFVAAQVRGLVENAAAVFAAVPKSAAPRLLVLAPPELLAQAQQLGAGGRLPGVLVDYQAVAAGATPTDVKALIAASYARGDLNSVLLFGDETKIPLYHWDAATPGDWFYALLTASNYASVGLGRLPVRSPDDAATVLAKLARYDQLQRAGHVNPRVLLVAHRQDYPGTYTANQESVRTAPNPAGLRFVTQYGGEAATDQSVLDAANQGYGIVSYRGHGDHTSWFQWSSAAQSFGTPEVHQLATADGGLAVFLNVACETGALGTTPPSMTDELLLYRGADTPLHGAIAVVASTADSFTVMNSTFQQYLFAALEADVPPDLGTLLGVANNRLIRDFGGDIDRAANVKMYILFGDPMLRPWLR